MQEERMPQTLVLNKKKDERTSCGTFQNGEFKNSS
jgi:hypothetical protein